MYSLLHLLMWKISVRNVTEMKWNLILIVRSYNNAIKNIYFMLQSW